MPETKCRVCEALTPVELAELDALMGDPSAWPASLWPEMFEPPRGSLPASYRRFGAVEMGAAWLTEHGIAVERKDVRRHYRFDTPKIATTPEDLVATGLIAKGKTAGTDVATLNPLAYLTYYNTGIEVGIAGLELLRDRIAQLKEAGKEVPVALIKMAIDAGSKLAMSQATIKAAGKPFGDADDSDDGFMAGSAPAPGQRLGDHRIRVIDGEARPVRDTGPADRAAYSARARQEGSPTLPHR